MIGLAEAGKVKTVIVKDMSRMGRDYLKVGQVMEILRQHGVRLIAINDGVDSDKGDNDFTPFRNLFNDFYARDTSKKSAPLCGQRATPENIFAATRPMGM